MNTGRGEHLCRDQCGRQAVRGDVAEHGPDTAATKAREEYRSRRQRTRQPRIAPRYVSVALQH